MPEHGDTSCGREWVKESLVTWQDEAGQSNSAFANAKHIGNLLR